MGNFFARFDNLENAVKAGGALLDHGVEKDHFDLLTSEEHREHFPNAKRSTSGALESKESKVEHGVTTTSGADAKEGAKKGGVGGLVLGAVAGLASIIIPGYGIVTGSGALATAIGAALGTGVAGAAAGGVTGYLKDMGVDAEVARQYDETVRGGGAIIALQLPSGGVNEAKARELLSKYGALQIDASPAKASI